MKADKLVSVLSEASSNNGSNTSDIINKVGGAVSNTLELIGIMTARQTITNISKDSLLQFPILIENNVSELNLVTLNKALEHEFISFIVLALNNIIVNKIDAGGTVGELLKKIHTNVEGTVQDNLKRYSTALSAIKNEDIKIEEMNIDSVLIEDTTFKELEAYNENCVLFPIGEELNESILNHSSFPEFILNEVVDTKDMKPDGTKYNVKPDVNSAKTFTIDYKKLNMMAPTIVKCKINYIINTGTKDKKTGVLITKQESTDLVFGVKTVLHPIDTEEYISVMNDVYKTGKFPVRLVKFLTGELKALDFLFNAAEAKKRANQVYGKKGESGYWWNKLEDLANQDKAMKIAKAYSKNKDDVNLMTAVTTLVITKSSAIRIKNKLGNNIFDRPDIVNEIFKKFFIMGFMIIDEPSNHLYVYDTNRNDYKVVSLGSLKAIAKEEIGVGKDGTATFFDR